MDWREEYERKSISAEEAAKVVKSGDYVVFGGGGPEPVAFGLALAARKEELHNITLYVRGVTTDFAWYSPGWEDSFRVEVPFVFPLVQRAVRERRCEFCVGDLVPGDRPLRANKTIDVVCLQVSPPDEKGDCSFGASLWSKKSLVKIAKVAIGEVNKNFIRTHGDNSIHVSEFDYFIEHLSSGKTPGGGDLLGRGVTEPGTVEEGIAQHVASLIKDGDTLEIGLGRASECIPRFNVLNDKGDLGWHSENTPRGIATLVRNGVVTGKRKTLHKGKAVATAVGGGTKEEMEFINMNPVFELYCSDYVLDPRVIAAHDNMVAINSALAVDLTGQIASESLGPLLISGSGGNVPFTIGALLSKGGRSITVLPSTAQKGTVSRIVPQLPGGTIVSVPRALADFVVTEFGIACLRGKTQRERALELTSIAHPDFRSVLRKEALSLF
ncbi:MAG: 4-hydroxybutyrate CoA-transferase [Chloroflexi bacterium]|nr:4-hydroxybutyrate CoA-transferase [Chloroflexota bacterium]